MFKKYGSSGIQIVGIQILILLFLISCSSDAANEAKYVSNVTFKFIDAENNPIKNTEIYIDNDSTDGTREIATILGKTNNEGIIVRDKNEVREYRIEVYNVSFKLTENDAGTKKIITLN